MRTRDEHIRGHQATILVERELDQPNEGRIRHWDAEIRAFCNGIDRARERLEAMR